MAGKSVLTQERVSKAANELRAGGVFWPSAENIRDHLKANNPPEMVKVGASNIIQQYLTSWRMEVSGKSTDFSHSKLPSAVVTSIENALHETEQMARKEYSSVLEGAEKEAADVRRFATELEIELEQVRWEIEQSRTERNEIAGQNALLAAELVEYKRLLASSAEVQSQLRTQIATISYRESRLEELRSESSSRENEARDQFREVSAEINNERNARIDAQRTAEHLQIQLLSKSQALDTAEHRINALLAQVQQLSLIHI